MIPFLLIAAVAFLPLALVVLIARPPTASRELGRQDHNYIFDPMRFKL